MAPSRTSLKCLKALLADRYEHLPACRVPAPPAAPRRPCCQDDEDRIFRAAMADVQPLSESRCLMPPPGGRSVLPRAGGFPKSPDGVRALRKLVECGDGFVVAHTSEYIEGCGCKAAPGISSRLHRGEFSIQAHIDLHGLTVKQARPAIDAFLYDAVTTGKRTVLIIHGRGLSSPGEPVLKTRVAAWLSRGRWRRYVIAFATARNCDGGAGATTVLLRERPVSRRRDKKAG